MGASTGTIQVTGLYNGGAAWVLGFSRDYRVYIRIISLGLSGTVYMGLYRANVGEHPLIMLATGFGVTAVKFIGPPPSGRGVVPPASGITPHAEGILFEYSQPQGDQLKLLLPLVVRDLFDHPAPHAPSLS